MKTTPLKELQQRKRGAKSSTKSVAARARMPATSKLPPVRFKTILAPTDFSEFSRQGVRAAVALGAKLGAAVALIHVVKPAPSFAGTETSLGPRDDLDVLELAEKELAGMAKAFSKKMATVEPVVRYGQPLHEICELARSRGVDLIVTATHGHSGLKRVLLGSTAERVVRHAPCPVLTIPSRSWVGHDENASGFQLNQIVVPIDGSKTSVAALPYAAELARRFGAEVLLLHVLEPPAMPVELQQVLQVQGVDEASRQAAREHLLRLSRELLPESISTSVQVRVGVPFKEITESAKRLEADLIVLTTHGYTGLNRVLLGSTAERVVRHAECPVLVVQAGRRLRRPAALRI